ncbi:MAG: hypothetical protein RL264_1962 [Bacteroidota bacterium]|jgi:rfaE bifunctional protein nucleotidyltransferase chain/domain
MNDLRLSFLQEKILEQDALLRRLAVWRLAGKKIVFTNGCFDILHRGHITYLAKAAELGDKLVIGINSDASVQQLEKAPNRPINTLSDRQLLVAALGFVDAVVAFEGPTPLELISLVEPEVLVKGADYDADETDATSKKYIVGSDLVRSYGGEVKTISLVEGYSTTNLINKAAK